MGFPSSSVGKESAYPVFLDFFCGSAGKEYKCNAGDLGSIPGLGDPLERERLPIQDSGLENSMDCMIPGVAKSQTRLSDFHAQPYMTTGKTIALNTWTFAGKVMCLLFFFMCLLFKMLSRLVITYLPRGKRLLISWLQSPSAVILKPPKIRSATVSTDSPSICHEVMGPDAMILVF